MSMSSTAGAGAWIIAEAIESDEGEAEAPGASPSPAADEAAAPVGRAKPRILLVEDDFLVGMEIEAGLRDAGCDVVGVAATAEEAVMVAEAERPRLVVKIGRAHV